MRTRHLDITEEIAKLITTPTTLSINTDSFLKWWLHQQVKSDGYVHAGKKDDNIPTQQAS